MKRALTALVTTGILAASSAASAQDFGRQGDVAFGIDRVFGLYFMEVDQELRSGGDVEVDITEFGLGWGVPNHAITPFTIPRFAFDIFVIDQLSVGGTLAYASWSDDDDSDFSAFILHPRVGYFIPISRVFGFWPRGGFTYHNYGDDADEDGIALTVEGMFTVTPVPHFGFLFGPLLDLSISGERNNLDRKYRVFGIAGGLFGWI